MSKPLSSLKSKYTIFFGLALLFSAVACNYKKPGIEVPPPAQSAQQSVQGIEKSFFQTKVNQKVDGTEKVVWQPKTFLCGWASESEVGWASEETLSHNAPITGHCNVEFEITESKLVGRMINPSFPHDTKRWETIVTIPIEKHYYYERKKDENGRETNTFVEESDRSHWSARPMMKLNLAGMTVQDHWLGLTVSGASKIHGVEDVEWDNEKNFLGFTLAVADAVYTTVNEARIRVNFLKFDHNPQFKKTPFNDKNSRFMNVLHILGEKAEGVYPILHAAHWDLSKKHEIYLHGFPEEHRVLGEQVIQEWNEALRSVGALKDGAPGFVVSEKKNLKHPFDLRYPSIVWVSDKKISSYSALGIGMAQADVRNGEILWGGITLYGGLLESYIKSYLPSQPKGTVENKIAKDVVSKMSQRAVSLPPSLGADKINSSKFGSALGEIQSKMSGASSQKSVQSFADLFVKKNLNLDEVSKVSKGQSESPDSLKNNKKIEREMRGNVACTSRTFEDIAGGWHQAMSSMKRDYRDVVQTVVKELISHEYGHFLGLGHQFKENILPAEGTVPSEIKEWGYSLKEQKERATEKNNFSQFSSVMGYRSPRAELATPVELIKPGPQDRLVLAYLYTQKYSTYKKGDQHFQFTEVGANGIIPDSAAYFPQCNDWQASVSVDPYCNRFDRGNKASEIVSNYLSDMNDTLVQTLFSFTDARNGNFEYAEWRLWNRSFDTFGRVRVFYDYMRRKYKNIFDQVRGDEKALYDFSKSCQSFQKEGASTGGGFWAQAFTQNPELADLCVANQKALADFTEKFKLNASDYTKLDIDSAYIPTGISGGDAERDTSKWLGSWSELSALPIKIASIFALTNPEPWVVFHGGGLMSIPHYSTPDQKFSYGVLFPREYTMAISAALKNNLRFASLGFDETTGFGQLALSLGFFNFLANMNNDAARFPPNLVEQIRNQTKFNFSYVAILLTAQQKDSDKGTQSYTRFNPEIYDMSTNQKTQATEAYLLPNGQVIARAENMFLYPVTKFQFLDDKMGYVIAYKLDYFRENNDPLSEIGAKSKLKEVHDTVMSACTKGVQGHLNGLSQFFNNTEDQFKGFTIPVGISTDVTEEKRKIFLDSITVGFDAYYKSDHFKEKPKPETCREALRGLGLIVSSAALMNGYWIPEIEDFIQR